MQEQNFKVELLKHPTEKDWEWCKICTLNTVGKKMVNSPDSKWKSKILESEHSPIRELWFGFRLNIPYYVSVHLCRHGTGINHFVQSQRNDRQDNYDRTKAPQDALVSHIVSVNAQELMFMARKRLCKQADPLTQQVMKEICNQAITACPELEGLLEPLCSYRNGKCTEFYPCGYNKKFIKE